MEILRLLLPVRIRLDAAAGLECLLRENRPLRLAGARGQRICCTAGRAWITAPGVTADVFLEPGEEWRCDSDGLVLVEGVGWGAVAIR